MACACNNSNCTQNRKSVRCGHGSYSMYVNHRCRCDLCRAANAKVGRDRYEAHRLPKPDVCGCGNADCQRRTRRTVVHGLSCYFAHKCRCAICVRGMREYQQNRRAKLRQAKSVTATITPATIEAPEMGVFGEKFLSA